MSDQILFLFKDLQAAGLDLDWRDIQKALSWILAAAIFLVPLSGIDRRHEVTQMTYVATAASLAAVQVFVLSGDARDSHNFIGFVITTMIFIFFATGRWMWRAEESQQQEGSDGGKK